MECGISLALGLLWLTDALTGKNITKVQSSRFAFFLSDKIASSQELRIRSPSTILQARVAIGAAVTESDKDPAKIAPVQQIERYTF